MTFRGDQDCRAVTAHDQRLTLLTVLLHGRAFYCGYPLEGFFRKCSESSPVADQSHPTETFLSRGAEPAAIGLDKLARNLALTSPDRSSTGVPAPVSTKSALARQLQRMGGD